MLTIPNATKVELSNGLVVANFSSPHPFNFEDGTVLEACSPERARALMLVATEIESVVEVRGRQVIDIDLSFSMTPTVEQELSELCLDESIDIVLVPLPVLQCARARSARSINRKVRGIRVADRVTKAIHINRFCV